nr:Gfo/Idh/MocA family oxidoreductase [Parabacteroides pacaensis]
MKTMTTNKVRFAVIGTNFITDWVIAGGMQDKRFELVAVYSRTQEQANLFAAKYNIPYIFTSLEELASSDFVDAVYIASPNFLHAAQSILMIEHGKHILCEKPLASNVREVKEMIAAANRNDVVLMEAMKPTLTPNFLAVRNNINKVGKIRRYFSCYCQYSSRYDKFKEGIVLNAFNPELSNGALVDIGIYTIYPMVVLFGRPDNIKATGIKLSTGVDGQGCVLFKYTSKEMDAMVMYSKIANSSLPTEIQGEDGNIILDRINIISDVRLMYRGGGGENLTIPNCGHEYYYEVKEFIDLIQTGKKESAINSHENTLITMEIMDEIRRQLGVVYPADQ